MTFEVSAGSNIANIVNSTKVKFSGLGSVTVKATQAGNNEYVAAAPVTQTFLVKKPMLLIFDPVGDMGRGQTFPVRAKAFDLVTRKPLPIMPTFSVTAGSAMANGHSITCGNSLGQVTIKASATSSTYQTTEQSQTFNVTNKDGQWIVFKQGEKGGLRDLPLSRKPIPLGKFATTSSGLPVRPPSSPAPGSSLPAAPPSGMLSSRAGQSCGCWNSMATALGPGRSCSTMAVAPVRPTSTPPPAAASGRAAAASGRSESGGLVAA